ncbi:hypothetical protein PshuTeo1_41560 [Pseudomonas hunanensis]|nr:hypothetical protein PshuTeo1_41560 [Pseudomonas hunanensis]
MYPYHQLSMRKHHIYHLQEAINTLIVVFMLYIMRIPENQPYAGSTRTELEESISINKIHRMLTKCSTDHRRPRAK